MIEIDKGTVGRHKNRLAVGVASDASRLPKSNVASSLVAL